MKLGKAAHPVRKAGHGGLLGSGQDVRIRPGLAQRRITCPQRLAKVRAKRRTFHLAVKFDSGLTSCVTRCNALLWGNALF